MQPFFVAWDEKRAYYLMGATHPDRRSDAAGTLVMFAAMEDLSQNLPEMDLVGANIPIIARFKRGFGGMLKSYFVLSSTPSLSLLSYQLLRELVSRVRERFRRRQPQD